jgi:hypothetical protein
MENVTIERPALGSSTTALTIAHLRRLGYEIKMQEDVIVAKHPWLLTIMLEELCAGVLLASLWRVGSAAREDRTGYLEFVNSLNEEAIVARVYADRANSGLLFQAWFPGTYEESRFSLFLEAWNHDTIQLLVERESVARKYLG